MSQEHVTIYRSAGGLVEVDGIDQVAIERLAVAAGETRGSDRAGEPMLVCRRGGVVIAQFRLSQIDGYVTAEATP